MPLKRPSFLEREQQAVVVEDIENATRLLGTDIIIAYGFSLIH